MGYFKNPETEAIRVQKLNTLELRVIYLEDAVASGGSTLDIDGGDANNSGVPYIGVDGGGA